MKKAPVELIEAHEFRAKFAPMKTQALRAAAPRTRTLRAVAAGLVWLAPLLGNASTVGLHLGSRHDAPGFDDANVGVYAVSDEGWTFGTFNNSESRQSVYVGKTWHFPLTQRLAASATAGAVTGYDSAISPLLVPSLAFEFAPGLRLRSAVLFKVNKTGANAIHWMIEKEFR